jgi:hypothetical protein
MYQLNIFCVVRRRRVLGYQLNDKSLFDFAILQIKSVFLNKILKNVLLRVLFKKWECKNVKKKNYIFKSQTM